jgi:hypothetical protein
VHRDTELADLDAGLEFNHAAFGLDPADKERYFSDPVTNSRSVFVLAACGERQPPRIPALEEVRERILPMVEAEKKEETFNARSTELRGKLGQAVAAGAAFADSARGLAMNVSTSMTFSAYSAQQTTNMLLRAVVPRLHSLEKGELSEVIRFRDTALLAYVANREAGPMEAALGLKQGVASMLERQRSGMAFQEWGLAALAPASFRDLQAATRTESD